MSNRTVQEAPFELEVARDRPSATRPVPAPRPLRLGVLGCGIRGTQLLREFACVEGTSVVMATDPSAERLASLALEHPDVETTRSQCTLITDDAIDAVVIATPIETHHVLARAALEAGKHVFVESPLGRSTREARELVERAALAHRILMVDHAVLFTAAVQKIKTRIDAGEIGRVLGFDALRIQPGPSRPDLDVLWDLASHDLAILLHLVGRVPVAVSAVGVSHDTEAPQSIAHGTFFFGDDTLAHVHARWLAPLDRCQLIVGGEHEVIVCDQVAGNETVKFHERGAPSASGDPGQTLVEAPPEGDALRRQCRYFVDCVRHRRRPFNDGKSGLRVVRLLEAASASMRRGRRVDVV